jgi:hypothetical protein
MAYINGEKQLVDLLKHSLVNPRIDRGIWNGISGGTKIDYGLSKIEEAIKEEAKSQNPDVNELIKKYEAFKQLNPLRYGPRVTVDYTTKKNPY